MTLFRLALRLQLIGLAATAFVGALNGFGQTAAFAEIAGNTPAQRALFAQQMELIARQLSYLLPLPEQLDTMAGYLHWRSFGVMPLPYAFWALLAASGAGRGDEERGLVETWLAAGVGRMRYLLIRWVAFALAAALSIGVLMLTTAIGTQLVSDPIPSDRLVAHGVALLLLTLVCYGIGLLAAQLVTTRRAAVGLGAIVTLALFVLNSAARMGADVAALVPVSPFWQYDRQRPLLAGGGLDGATAIALAAEGLGLAVAAMAAFAARDLGGPLVRRRSALTGGHARRPSRNPLLRVPVLAPVWQQRVWVASWMIGLGLLAAYLVSLTRVVVDSLKGSGIPVFEAYLQRMGISAYSSFVGVIWFSTLVLMLSIYAIAQVASWSSDDAEGRLEAVLATPVSRTRVVLERLLAALVAVGLVVAASSVAAYAGATSASIDLDVERFALASALSLTVAFAFAAIGHLIAAWRPRAAVIALSAVAVWSYFVQQFAPLFDWPESVANLSLYTLYGTPMTGDVNWPGIGGLVAIGVAGTVLAVVAMQRRDVGA